MKNKLTVILALALIVGTVSLTACTNKVKTEPVSNNSNPVSEETTNVDSYKFGAQGAKNDDTLTVEEMLKYAIEDEYLARGEYEIIMDKFGEEKPFVNIIKAEEKHIEQLTALFTKNNYVLPEDISKDYVMVPESLTESYKAGVTAEIENIEMYERFLKEPISEDVRDVFVALRDGSKSHLSSFEKQL